MASLASVHSIGNLPSIGITAVTTLRRVSKFAVLYNGVASLFEQNPRRVASLFEHPV